MTSSLKCKNAWCGRIKRDKHGVSCHSFHWLSIVMLTGAVNIWQYARIWYLLWSCLLIWRDFGTFAYVSLLFIVQPVFKNYAAEWKCDWVFLPMLLTN